MSDSTWPKSPWMAITPERTFIRTVLPVASPLTPRGGNDTTPTPAAKARTLETRRERGTRQDAPAASAHPEESESGLDNFIVSPNSRMHTPKAVPTLSNKPCQLLEQGETLTSAPGRDEGTEKRRRKRPRTASDEEPCEGDAVTERADAMTSGGPAGEKDHGEAAQHITLPNGHRISRRALEEYLRACNNEGDAMEDVVATKEESMAEPQTNATWESAHQLKTQRANLKGNVLPALARAAAQPAMHEWQEPPASQARPRPRTLHPPAPGLARTRGATGAEHRGYSSLENALTERSLQTSVHKTADPRPNAPRARGMQPVDPRLQHQPPTAVATQPNQWQTAENLSTHPRMQTVTMELPPLTEATTADQRVQQLNASGLLRVTPAPHGGFPRRPPLSPYDRERYMDEQQEERWSAEVTGTKIAAEVFGVNGTVRDVEKVKRTLRATIALITGIQTITVEAPTRTGPETPGVDAPSVWFVYGLTPVAVHVLTEYEVWSTARITFFAKAELVEIPQYLLTLEGFAHDEDGCIERGVKEILRHPDVLRQVETTMKEGVNRTANLREEALAFVNNIEVIVGEHGTGTDLEQGGHVAVLYASPPPTQSPHKWLRWRESLRALDFELSPENVGTARAPERCRGCHAGDHAELFCPYMSVPGWQGSLRAHSQHERSAPVQRPAENATGRPNLGDRAHTRNQQGPPPMGERYPRATGQPRAQHARGPAPLHLAHHAHHEPRNREYSNVQYGQQNLPPMWQLQHSQGALSNSHGPAYTAGYAPQHASASNTMPAPGMQMSAFSTQYQGMWGQGDARGRGRGRRGLPRMNRQMRRALERAPGYEYGGYEEAEE
ncbi:hypothetical protein C8Q73DRAFT_115614 [Cubamyces lactineus]|nr:hypothetical protein C8Q73DRAFT_115614 [Cubamyces lactineus]